MTSCNIENPFLPAFLTSQNHPYLWHLLLLDHQAHPGSLPVGGCKLINNQSLPLPPKKLTQEMPLSTLGYIYQPWLSILSILRLCQRKSQIYYIIKSKWGHTTVKCELKSCVLSTWRCLCSASANTVTSLWVPRHQPGSVTACPEMNWGSLIHGTQLYLLVPELPIRSTSGELSDDTALEG